MANEINEGSDKVEKQINQGDRTSENTSKDSVIGGDRHQTIHSEMSKAGQTFGTFSDNDDDQSMQAVKPGETAEQYQIRLAERNKQTVAPLQLFDSETGEVHYDASKRTKNGDNSVVEGSEKIKIALKGHEKPIPKDGETFKLKQLLNDYKTPFIDAYNRSRSLRNDEPGKSLMLEETISRLQTVPWRAKLDIKFDSAVPNPEYNPIDSRITINNKHDPLRQIEEFVHESFHATHQGIGALYINKAKPVSAEEYFNERAKGEIGSFIAEIRVNAELKNPRPVEFEHVVNGKAVNENLTALYESKGEEGLRNFLLDARPPLKINGRAQLDFFQNLQTMESYREHYQESYQKYRDTFQQAKPQAGAVLREYQKQNPGKTSDDFINEGY